MQILAIDTASPAPSVTLLARGGVWEEALPLPPKESRRASEELLPAIERCFTAAGSLLAECDRIAVCAGPGSFTGLRIGLATAWALGRASGLPVEMVPTLEVMAETAREHNSTLARVAAALDAGRGEVVLAFYSLRGERATIEEAPERIGIDLARRRVAGTPAVTMPPDLLSATGTGPALSPSRALALTVARAPGEALSRLEGIYSRPSAAEEKHGAA